DIGELVDEPEPLRRGDLLDDRIAFTLVVARSARDTAGGDRLQAGDMAVERCGKKARAAHLAIAHDVDAGIFLVAERQVDGVVERLLNVNWAIFAALGGCERGKEPGRPGIRSDHTRR